MINQHFKKLSNYFIYIFYKTSTFFLPPKIMLTNNIEKDLQNYIDEHIKMQLFCYNLISVADKLGFPGFSHYFQVKLQDEVLHERRIMNFVLYRYRHYKIKNIAE